MCVLIGSVLCVRAGVCDCSMLNDIPLLFFMLALCSFTSGGCIALWRKEYNPSFYRTRRHSDQHPSRHGDRSVWHRWLADLHPGCRKWSQLGSVGARHRLDHARAESQPTWVSSVVAAFSSSSPAFLHRRYATHIKDIYLCVWQFVIVINSPLNFLCSDLCCVN